MKSFVGLILLFFSVGCFALPDCPKDQTKRYHNCFGAYESDEFKYVGDWKNDKKHGHGTYESDEFKYVGDWKNDKKHGHGTYTWLLGPNKGDKYVGEWKDDNFHGQGTYTWNYGDQYVGEFKEDRIHGQGTHTFADGEIQEGIWRNGELVEEKQMIVEEKEKQVLPKKIDKWLKITSADGYTLYQDTEDLKKLNEIVYYVAMIDAFEPLDGVVYSIVERRKTDCAVVKEYLKNRSGKIPSTIIHRTGYSQPMAKGNILYEVPVGETEELSGRSAMGLLTSGACLFATVREINEKQKLK